MLFGLIKFSQGAFVMEEILKGKKTYLVAIIGGLMAGLEWYGIHIPEFVYTMLGSMGLFSLRHGMKTEAGK